MKVFNIRAKVIEAIKAECEIGDIIMYAPNGGNGICNTSKTNVNNHKYILTDPAGVLVVGDNLMSNELFGIDFENPRFVIIGNINQSLEEIRDNILKCNLFNFVDYEEHDERTGLYFSIRGDRGLDELMDEVENVTNQK